MWLLRTVPLLIVAAMVEIASYAFGELSVRGANVYQFYRPDFFDRADLSAAARARHRPVGWPDMWEPRPEKGVFTRLCAAAFGDSFTYGDEVGDDETWPHYLAVATQCEVRNFGYSAYGADHAVLRDEEERPPSRVVLLGVSAEMPRRSVAASWTFYGGSSLQRRYGFPDYYYEKPYFRPSGEGLEPVPLPAEPVTPDSLRRHHRLDYFMQHRWTRLAFPYSAAAARAVYLRFAEPEDFTAERWQPEHPSGAAELTLRLIGRMRQEVLEAGSELVVVMIPPPDELAGAVPLYTPFLGALKQRYRETCVINPFPELRRRTIAGGRSALRAPDGHYLGVGNQIVADAVQRGLRDCGVAL